MLKGSIQKNAEPAPSAGGRQGIAHASLVFENRAGIGPSLAGRIHAALHDN